MTDVNTTNQQYMTQTDFMSWRMEEDPILRSTIVAVALLDRSPNQARFVDMMRRAVELVPIFKRKAIVNPMGIAPPRWTDDQDFDLSWHLRRYTLAEPRTWGDVLDFARTAGMTAFDKRRPLWEFTVLDGLDDGKSALVMKVHHSLTDGVGGMQIAQEIVDFTRDGASPAGRTERRTAAPDDELPILPDWLSWWWDTATGVARIAPNALGRHSARLALAPRAAWHEVAALAGSALRLTRPVASTLSPVMTKRSTRRHCAVFDVPVEALAQAAATAAVSINDAFLAAVLLGMVQYHRLHGSEISTMRMTLPISLRTEADPVGGNRITLARLALPTDVDDPAELMCRVHTVVEAWRHEPAIPLSPVIAGVLNLLPASSLGNMLEHVDFVASNVVGSPEPLFIAGSEILRYYAFSPTLGSAFNVTLLSYTTRCCVGINADPDAVPDLAALTDSIADGFRTVLELCEKTTDTRVVVVQ
ncbi:wax ester/triacylglycerol synthase domain-containing protein [Rhodococcus artemisiae]|uniref:diacylglycerol O-acyltransferase n=1 Tax=Rhodococcus artemisiae TaxID=714159 RepID=A0ABU7LJF1_9NOCA|nr:wax ester/triacylglycerol synthase domain-containing protein [Rhodococcus artemisiae]MEE2061364.1 wax ester/triacylglycerol synthase family O-acyltransferase [Rhodococcus artemisiae]